MQAAASRCIVVKQLAQMVDYVFNTYLPAHPVNLLIISARWAEADIPFIEPTLARLEKAGIRTMLVGPTPEYDVQLPSLIARSGTSSQGGSPVI